MAEGDTILRLARRIEDALAGRVVTVRTPHPRGRAAGLQRLDGATLKSASSKGKHLLITFALPLSEHADSSEDSAGVIPGECAATQSELVLHSHLGMSGGWHIYRPDERWRRPKSAAWAVVSAGPSANRDPGTGPAGGNPSSMSSGSGLTGVDLVQFGGPTLRLLRPEQVRRDPGLASLGPDVLAPEPFDLAAAIQSLRRAAPSMQLGEVLLDQTVIAGIGNIFKSEGCFAARLNPWRRLEELDDSELALVVSMTREMMIAAVAGKPRPRNVYRRARETCRRCGEQIRSRGQGEANRTTYWCAGCQE